MLPLLKEVQNPSKKYSLMFKGINYSEGTQDGEFAETFNLSASKYPCMTQRAARIKKAEYSKNATTLHVKGQLIVIDGTKVFYGDKKVGTVTEGKKQMATIGNYVVIFPDKKYYKVPTEEEEGEFGNMEAEFATPGLVFSPSSISSKTVLNESWLEFTKSTLSIGTECLCRNVFVDEKCLKMDKEFPFKAGDVVSISGSDFDDTNKKNIVITKVEFKNSEGYIYFDGYTFSHQYYTETSLTITRKVNNKLSVFKAGDTIEISGCSKSGHNKEVVVKDATETTLTFEDGTFDSGRSLGDITITRTNIAKFPFEKGDTVKITGCDAEENNKEIIIREVKDGELVFDENSFTAGTAATEVTLKREVPELDFICESNYRLWGTHGNTIYASKYADPINFKSFEGLTGDSYYIEVPSEGEFTGCIPYSTHICFFKENTLHKLYGSKPSNYQISSSSVYGVQSGSERSIQIVNEQLIYKGVGGVYAYTGGVPELISGSFGNNRYTDAVACCDGEIYYISMKDSKGNWNLFSYDVLKNIWLREDDTKAVDMAFYDGKINFIDGNGDLYLIDKTEGKTDLYWDADSDKVRKDIEWSATFCPIHETINERKGYSKFHLRLDLSAGAWLSVDVKTDRDNVWKQVYTTHNAKAKTITVPIMPTRCDCINIRLRGKGECVIKAFIREFTVGSDV